MKKLLILLTIVSLILPSCKKTPVITLSVDKTEISANGVDMAKFKVICNNEDDVTEEARIFFADTNKELTNKTFSTTEPKTYTFYATYDDATSGKVTVKAKAVEEPEPDPKPTLKLVADKTEIYNDGVDQVTFTVFYDENELSDGYKILNIDKNTLLESNVYSSTEVYACSFVAILEDDEEVKSNEVTINVLVKPDPVVKLIADKTAIKNDGVDMVTFTVLVDGEDRTAESVILDMTFGGVYEGTTFSSERMGDYAFKAKWNEYESEMVVINVYEPQAYAPGDLYDVDGVKGVVFYVEEGGKSGLIMSMDQALLKWSTEYAWANCLSNKGEWNTEDMLKLGADKYPAAKWCVEHGEGWYMPSSYEMNLMWTAVSDGKHDFDHEFIKLYNDKLDDPILENYYWSSNETTENMATVVVFIDKSVTCLEPYKTSPFYVRAIHKF